MIRSRERDWCLLKRRKSTQKAHYLQLCESRGNLNSSPMNLTRQVHRWLALATRFLPTVTGSCLLLGKQKLAKSPETGAKRSWSIESWIFSGECRFPESCCANKVLLATLIWSPSTPNESRENEELDEQSPLAANYRAMLEAKEREIEQLRSQAEASDRQLKIQIKVTLKRNQLHT